MQQKILKEDGSLDYEALGIVPPQSFPHGTDDDIRKHMQVATAKRWFQRGNELVAETDLGEVINFLPTDIMLKGTDDNGLPILEKL